jgi:VRR-NUC domain
MQKLSILPDHVLKLMSEKDRKAYAKSIGQPTAGMTAAEATAVADGKHEAWIQRQFASYCTLRGYEYLWHRMDRRTGATPGWPDFLLVVSGKVVFVEFKTAKGKLSDDQERVQLALKKAGVPTLVTRSLSLAIEFIKTQEQK